jgi:hypothetical protein
MKESIISRKIVAILILIALVVCGCSSEADQQTVDEASIRSVYESYKTSLLNQDGSQAVKYVTASTIEYYDEMKEIALIVSEDAVRNLSTMNKYMVLILRHMVEPNVLSEMTAEELFIYGVNEGLIGEEDVANSDIGEVSINGDIATAVYINNGQPTSLEYEFAKDDGQWKLDLTSIMPVADQAMKQVILSSGYDEDEYLCMLLEYISGKKVSDNIWQPLIQTP